MQGQGTDPIHLQTEYSLQDQNIHCIKGGGRMFKKIIATVLVLAMVMSLCACGSKKENESSSSKTESKKTTSDSTSGSTATTDENIKVSIFIPSRKADALYSQDTLTLKKLSEKMNVTFDIQTVINSESKSKLSSIISSGEIPDICAGNMTLLKTYGRDGAFVALDELIDDKYPNLKKYVIDDPEVMAQCVSSDGHLYVIPMLSAMRTAMGYMIRQDWLDELGLSTPVTIDDWYNVLTAFKNAKGIAPLFLDRAWELYYNNFSDAWGVEVSVNNNFWTLKDGKMVFSPLTDECKAYLTEMQKWYTEGLIDPEFITREDTCNYHVLNNLAGAGCYWTGYLAGFNENDEVKANDPKTNWQVVNPPVLKAGQEPKTFSQQAKTVGHSWAISADCKNVERVLQMFEYVYSDEGSMLFNFGEEGYSYEYVNGVPKYTQMVYDFGSTAWVHANGCQALIGMRQLPDYERAQAASDDACRQLFYYDEANLFYPLNPTLTPADDVQDEYDAIMSSACTYAEEETLKFFTGAKSMDEYDAFVATLKSMNIDRATEIINEAYATYSANFQ